MSKVNVSEASRLTGKSRTTLYKLMDSGQLSHTGEASGGRVLDTEELLRVFGSIGHAWTPQDTQPGQQITPNRTPVDTDLVAMLKGQLAAAQEREQRLLALLESAQALLALPSAPKEAPEPKRRGLWARIFGD